MADTLHDYQVLARDFFRNRDRSALFLDMGLGKTAASLSALEERHLPALVVAPKKVAEEVWDEEQEKWRPDLDTSVAMGEPDQRIAALYAGKPITTISKDNFAQVLRLPRMPFKTVIIDEMSRYKGRGVRWKDMRKLVHQPRVEHVWGLTGTPSPNGLLGLWPQIALLDDGERLGRNITTYRSRYFTPGRQLSNGTIIEWNLREGAEEKIYAKIEDIVLAMKTDGRIKLPAVTQNKVAIELPAASRKVYRRLANDLVVDMKTIFGDGEFHSAANAAVLTSKLSQVCAGFLFVDEADLRGGEYRLLHKEKVNAVREIVEGAQGSPVIVFYRFQPELAMLKEAFGSDAHTIDEPQLQRRWNRGEIPILLAHPASAGHGLNLQHGGHTIVWTSLPWDLEEWMQANKRLARQGQKHPVVVHILMGNKTIDHHILVRLGEKNESQDRLLDYLESPI